MQITRPVLGRLRRVVSPCLAVTILAILGWPIASAETDECALAAWGGTEDDFVYGVVRDQSSGSLYGNGNSFSFGLGDEDVLLFKFDAAANLEWVRRWGGTLDDDQEGIALAPSGDVYLTGYTLSFGGTGRNLFVLKYGSDGTFKWAKTWDWGGDDDADVIRADAAGNLYVAGSTASFDGRTKVLLLKLDSDGSMDWGRTWERAASPIADSINGMALDSAGNIVLVGNTVTTAAGTDALLLTFDPLGNLLFEFTWGGAQEDDAFSVVEDGAGSVYVTGATESYGEGGRDVFLLKLDSTGLVWSRAWGSSGSDDGGGLAALPSGDVYLSGSTDGFGDVDGDAFVVRFDSDGNFQLARSWGGANPDAFGDPNLQNPRLVYLPGATTSCTSVFEEITGVVTPNVGTVIAVGGVVTPVPVVPGIDTTGTQADPVDDPGCGGKFDVLLTAMTRTCIVMQGPGPTLMLSSGDCGPASAAGQVDLIRGSLDELGLSAGSVDLGNVECVGGRPLEVDRITELSAIPCPGAGIYYLARQTGALTFGTDSSGGFLRNLMSPDPPCP